MDQLKKYATERQREIIEAVEAHGTQAKAAKALGISLRSVERVLARAKKAAAKRGHAPDHDMTHTTPEGYSS